MAKKIVTQKENDLKTVNEIKEEVLQYAKDRIDIEIQNAYKKIEKKSLKRKNFKIFERDLFILILIAIIALMGYEMYNIGYFNKYIDKTNSIIEKNGYKKEDKEDISKDFSFHSKALDNIFISYNSSYLKDYYSGNLTNELLLSITLNNIDDEDIICEEDTYMINDEVFSNTFDKLFKDIKYKNKSFNYNGSPVKYLKSTNIYLAISKIEKENNIERIITDIEENNNLVTIKTIEGFVKDNKIYNIISKEEIDNYKDEQSFKDNKNKLNMLEYTFEYNDDNYKLIDIKKI